MRLNPASHHPLIPRASIQPPASPADDINLGLLIITYPQFRFSLHAHRRDRRPRWELVRKNAADPGLYALITADLSELVAALAAAQDRTGRHDRG